MLRPVCAPYSNFSKLNVTSPIPSVNGDIVDFADGSLYKSSNFLQQHLDALQLALYNDDIELANPLLQMTTASIRRDVNNLVKEIGMNHIDFNSTLQSTTMTFERLDRFQKNCRI